MMKEIAPGVSVPNSSRRVLFNDDPKGDDYRAAQGEVELIRRELSRLRSRLDDLGEIEARFPHDRLTAKVAGALTLDLMALYTLIHGERSFGRRAEQVDALWADATAHPERYVIKEQR